jgi:hypothetical protein
MFDRGYLNITRWRGAPVRVHWSTPLGALLFGGLQFLPVFWVAFLVLVLAHEFGHALLARRYGHHVLSIDVTGFGGRCRWAGAATAEERAKVAWGGVLAQGVLFVLALLALLLGLIPSGTTGAQLSSAFIHTNLVLIVLNLLPFAPLDGAEAWTLLTRARARRRGRGILEQLGVGPAARSRRASGEAKTEARPRRRLRTAADFAPRRPADQDNQELAELLRRIGDEAGEARRGRSAEDDR